ncbi:hypothetical protein KCU98_g7557, partial [Aureobasidium melanogenum]
MQSSNNESGGLNFVFESGSSGRENKKYVRSHAARVGWSQRSRKQAQQAAKDVDVAPNKDTTPKKRRKTSHQANNAVHGDQQQQQTYIPPPAAQPVVNKAGSVAGPAVEASTSPPMLPTQLPPPQHAKRGGQLMPFSVPRASNSAIRLPAHAPATTTSSSPSPPLQQPGQPAPVRAQDVRTSPPVQVASSAASIYPSTLEPSHWHTRPDPVQHEPVAQPSFVPLFRPAASPVTMHPPQIMPGADLPRPVPPTSPLPSPQLPPLANMHTSQPLSIGANWRQYDNMSVTNSEASRASTPVQAITTMHEEDTEAFARSPQRSSPRASTSFLELVLNEDYPMWKNVDSGSDSFSVFPVKWQPFYGRLLQNYRSNMLVQLDEILTGWTTDQKIEFNQMPLRLAGSEPCLFYSVLATAAIMMPPGLVNPIIPRWLSACTVECINQALSDPKRAYSDAAILTVNMVALFESCSGHGIAAATHQPILRRMVDERGGLTTIARIDNEDSKNLVRFLAWTDRVIRCQTGNPLMFEDFKEEESVIKTDWNGIWARMERRVEENNPQPIEELPDC